MATLSRCCVTRGEPDQLDPRMWLGRPGFVGLGGTNAGLP